MITHSKSTFASSLLARALILCLLCFMAKADYDVELKLEIDTNNPWFFESCSSEHTHGYDEVCTISSKPGNVGQILNFEASGKKGLFHYGIDYYFKAQFFDGTSEQTLAVHLFHDANHMHYQFSVEEIAYGRIWSAEDTYVDNADGKQSRMFTLDDVIHLHLEHDCDEECRTTQLDNNVLEANSDQEEDTCKFAYTQVALDAMAAVNDPTNLESRTLLLSDFEQAVGFSSGLQASGSLSWERIISCVLRCLYNGQSSMRRRVTTVWPVDMSTSGTQVDHVVEIQLIARVFGQFLQDGRIGPSIFPALMNMLSDVVNSMENFVRIAPRVNLYKGCRVRGCRENGRSYYEDVQQFVDSRVAQSSIQLVFDSIWDQLQLMFPLHAPLLMRSLIFTLVRLYKLHVIYFDYAQYK